ncbi:hypothetical protein SLS62_001614 [Diatrype stigma]|uniref:SRR1-like domain-containing protein n=1 Tax=Diatrype stigma TaxID=117547 RepID=A0AAN9UXX1_9PEZI
MSTSNTEAQRRREAVHTAQQELQNLYFGGVALYSKETIQLIINRLAQYLLNQPLNSIPIPDIRGNETEVVVFPTYMCQLGGPGNWRKAEADIIFYSIQELLEDTRHRDASSVYQSISVGYPDAKPCNEYGELQQYETLPVDDLDTLLETHRGVWEESEEFWQLKDIITSQPALAKVDKIVAFACGSLMDPSAAIDPDHMVQHAMLFSMRTFINEMKEELPSSAGEEVKIILQEPAYTDEDKVVLARAGATIVESPRAFLDVDERTLVVSISPNIPVRQIVADIARPAGMIYYNDKNEWVHWPNGVMPSLSTDPWSPRVAKMLERYAEIELPYPRRTRKIVLWARQPAAAAGGGL